MYYYIFCGHATCLSSNQVSSCGEEQTQRLKGMVNKLWLEEKQNVCLLQKDQQKQWEDQIQAKSANTYILLS